MSDRNSFFSYECPLNTEAGLDKAYSLFEETERMTRRKLQPDTLWVRYGYGMAMLEVDLEKAFSGS